MTKKYIDVDNLLLNLPNEPYKGVLKRILIQAPAADVMPVRHGRWIVNKEDVEGGNYLFRYRCSECKEQPHFDKDKYKFILSSYCPNCGAKMEGDGE